MVGFNIKVSDVKLNSTPDDWFLDGDGNLWRIDKCEPTMAFNIERGECLDIENISEPFTPVALVSCDIEVKNI